MTKKDRSDRRNIRPMTVSAPPPPLQTSSVPRMVRWIGQRRCTTSSLMCLVSGGVFESSWFLISRRNTHQKNRFWREFGWFLPPTPTFHHEFHFIYRTQSIHDAIGNVFHSLIVVSV